MDLTIYIEKKTVWKRFLFFPMRWNVWVCRKSTVKTSQPISYSADNDMKTRCFVMFSAGIKSKSYPRNIVRSKSICRAHKINRSFITHLYIRAQKFFGFYIENFFLDIILTNTLTTKWSIKFYFDIFFFYYLLYSVKKCCIEDNNKTRLFWTVVLKRMFTLIRRFGNWTQMCCYLGYSLKVSCAIFHFAYSNLNFIWNHLVVNMNFI